ncbi:MULTISPECIES: hypothetical protein [Lactobacillales]|uniref:hypothetical protein n=2 Tax=Bacilli TaxID=91061 RepID=UPI00077576F8|nr:hypothetical protein [Leuconostoc mesenteroides]MBZ1528079.1 hypothetical protein [Leuconostoc mesenteroides]MCT4383502.1 hypothetical protein [Leuconostoc suionicum]
MNTDLQPIQFGTGLKSTRPLRSTGKLSQRMSGVLTTDITYIQLTDKTWVYIASAYDPENRKVLSYQIADAMTAQLATSVIVKVLQRGDRFISDFCSNL